MRGYINSLAYISK